MQAKVYLEDMVGSINMELASLKGKKNIAVWGLGEYAEKIVVYSDLLNYNITHFVDAKRKGCFLGRKVYKPKQVRWDTIDAVVIASFYKCAEIRKILIEEYKYERLIVGLENFERSREFYKVDSRDVLEIEDQYRNVLLRNQIFRGIHKEKKCFILGGGPSLNEIDLTRINSEIVFAVNDFFRLGNVVNIDYYVVADPYYWDSKVISNTKGHFFDSLKALETFNPEIKYWFPVQFCEVMNKMEKNWNNLYYFHPGRLWERKTDYSVDLTKRIIGRWSVIQYCIELAIYMGVKAIFLLGCEETGIINFLRNYYEDIELEYAYKIDSDELQNIKEYRNARRLEDYLMGFSNIFKGYREMRDLCEEHEVELYTCAKKTLVRDVKFCDFEEAINYKN